MVSDFRRRKKRPRSRHAVPAFPTLPFETASPAFRCRCAFCGRNGAPRSRRACRGSRTRRNESSLPSAAQRSGNADSSLASRAQGSGERKYRCRVSTLSRPETRRGAAISQTGQNKKPKPKKGILKTAGFKRVFGSFLRVKKGTRSGERNSPSPRSGERNAHPPAPRRSAGHPGAAPLRYRRLFYHKKVAIAIPAKK